MSPKVSPYMREQMRLKRQRELADLRSFVRRMMAIVAEPLPVVDWRSGLASELWATSKVIPHPLRHHNRVHGCYRRNRRILGESL